MKTTGHFILLSGGLDSTTLAYHVRADKPNDYIVGITIDYGQRHAKEMEYAKRTMGHLKMEHTLVTMPNMNSLLSNSSASDIPKISYDKIEGVSPMYVPFRNGMMLSILAGKAQEWIGTNSDRQAMIYYGAHAEDGNNWAYPDCTPEFIGSLASAVYIGTYHKVRLHVPYMYSSKDEIIRLGSILEVPYENTWSCYVGGEIHCGECATCIARKEAFKRADVEDPTIYAN